MLRRFLRGLKYFLSTSQKISPKQHLSLESFLFYFNFSLFLFFPFLFFLGGGGGGGGADNFTGVLFILFDFFPAKAVIVSECVSFPILKYKTETFIKHEKTKTSWGKNVKWPESNL